MTRRRRVPLAIVPLVLVAGLAAWRWQSHLIGWVGAQYPARLAAGDDATGSMDKRRNVVTQIHQQLLLAPPADPLVPSLFDVTTVLMPRVARGEMTLAWAGYLYTNWARAITERHAAGDRPPDRAAIRSEIERQIAFFAIRERPDVPGAPLGDLLGGDDPDVLTLEAIERAHAEGRDLDLGREPIRRQ